MAGKRLAKRFERTFVDLDVEIEALFGKSVAHIFAQEGEAAFRAAEARLSQTWAARVPAVLAPGGGWVANREAVAHLRPVARIIYLRVSPAEALRRMGQGVRRRPLFAEGDPGEIMQRLYETRRGYYETESDLVVETDGLTRSALADRVAKAVAVALDL